MKLTLSLPDVFCPFPPSLSPHLEALQNYSLQFIQDFHLVHDEATLKQFATSRLASLIARGYPSGGLEELQIILDWHIISFLLDDQFDEEITSKQPEQIQAFIEHLLLLMRDPAVLPQGPIAQAFAALWRRIVGVSSLDWQQRFTRHFTESIWASHWHTCNEAEGALPSLDTFLEKRLATGGCYVLCDFLDIALGFELPPQIYASQEMQMLLQAAGRAGTWTNDLYSFSKEYARGETHNLIFTLQRLKGYSYQEAIAEVCSMIEQETRRFLEGKKRLQLSAPDLNQKAQHYLAGVETLVRANLDWSRETPRYQAC